MTSGQIRLRNLHRLFAESGCRRDNEFCRRIGVEPGYYSQIKDGDDKKIGDKVARRIETKLGLEVGWMDVDHATFQADQVDRRQSAVDENDDITGIVLAFKQMPAALQDHVKRLMFSIIAECPSGATRSTTHSPFTLSFKDSQHAERRLSEQTVARAEGR